jgi:hypothetical protein
VVSVCRNHPVASPYACQSPSLNPPPASSSFPRSRDSAGGAQLLGQRQKEQDAQHEQLKHKAPGAGRNTLHNLTLLPAPLRIDAGHMPQQGDANDGAPAAERPVSTTTSPEGRRHVFEGCNGGEGQQAGGGEGAVARAGARGQSLNGGSGGADRAGSAAKSRDRSRSRSQSRSGGASTLLMRQRY